MDPSGHSVWAALAMGAVSSAGFVLGAVAGAVSRVPHRGIATVAMSLLLGAFAFSASNVVLARFGGAHRKRCGDCVPQPTESQHPGSRVAIAVGNVLDAAPEAMVLGAALRDPVVPLTLAIAFSGLLAVCGFGLVILVDATLH